MIPQVGETCSFTFITKFSSIDGVYRVRAETTFADCISSGVDFVENLYTPVGLDRAEFNTDYIGYKNDKVMTLESVQNNNIVYYVPESIFLTIPDPTIKEYYPLELVVDLGVQSNTQVVLPLIDAVKDLIQASLGTTDPLRLITNKQNRVYLTDSQYDALVAAREANIQVLVPLSVQLKQEQDKNIYLAEKIAQYEALITSIGI